MFRAEGTASAKALRTGGVQSIGVALGSGLILRLPLLPGSMSNHRAPTNT